MDVTEREIWKQSDILHINMEMIVVETVFMCGSCCASMQRTRLVRQRPQDNHWLISSFPVLFCSRPNVTLSQVSMHVHTWTMTIAASSIILSNATMYSCVSPWLHPGSPADVGNTGKRSPAAAALAAALHSCCDTSCTKCAASSAASWSPANNKLWCRRSSSWRVRAAEVGLA